MTSEAYKENYDKIFKGRNRPETGSWVWHPETMELIPKDEYVSPYNSSRGGPMIMKNLEDFKSPIDGSVIGDRRQLREHNARHGVTSIEDYGSNSGQAYFERKARERDATMRGATRQAKEERVDLIKRTLDQHGI